MNGGGNANGVPAPLVTIITVVYNGAETLERCIASVANQTYENIEYIVIDGASTDDTLEVIRKHTIDITYFVSEPDEGIYDAMNKGLAIASGEYIAFLNADDYYLTHAVEASITHIQRNNLDISYAGFQYADSTGHALVADEPRAWNDSMLIQGIPGGHETFFARRRCFEKLGGYDTSFKIAADYDWVMRAYEADFKAQPLNKIILVMATGGASFSEDIELSENNRLFSRNFGIRDDETLRRLYQLKYYKNWHGSSLSDGDMLELLPVAKSHSRAFFDALFLTIENRKQKLTGVVTPAEDPDPGKCKIAIVLTFMTGVSGGAERIAAEMANELSRQGHAVTFVACHGVAGESYYPLDVAIPYIDLGIHPYTQQYLDLGVDLKLEFSDWADRSFEELNYFPTAEDFDAWCQAGNLWRCRVYRGFFKAHKFDVVISHMPSTYPFVLLGLDENDEAFHIAALHNAPRFKFYSDLYPAADMMERYMRLAALEKANKISLLFDEYIDQMPKAYREKCFVLPNFTNQEAKPPTMGRSPNKVIVSVGRLTNQKNHAALLRSYVGIRERYPEWELRIYGDGPLRDELSSLCDRLGLSHEDIFRGTRRDIRTAYESADIFAFPSVFEGFPVTLLEAMNAGLPVVGYSDCEGVKYLVEHESNGLLVEQSSQGDPLADALIRLIESPNERNALGEKGRETAARYSLANTIEAFEAAITPHVTNRTGLTKAGAAEKSTISAAMIATYGEGGAGIAAIRLHKGLLRDGLKSRLFSFSESGDPHHYQLQLKPSKLALADSLQPIVQDGNRREGSTLFSTSYPGVTADQLAFADAFDVINIHWVSRILTNETIGYLATLGKPVVWTLHDMNPFTGGCHYASGCEKYQSDCRDCFQLLDTYGDYPASVLEAKARHLPSDIVVVAPSRWLADCARKSMVFRKNRIEIIPNSIDTDIFKPTPRNEAKRKLGLPLDCKILLFTCHDHKERRKGFRELLEAAEILKDQDSAYHVITFGIEVPEIEMLGLPHTSLGYIVDEDQLALGYSAADVTVLPTLEDNLPNTILESAACGTPVVAFDSGGVGDAVINEVTGSLVRQGDCRTLAVEIERLANEDFRERCRKYAVRNFSLPVQARRYRNLYAELLGSVRAAEPIAPLEVFPEVAGHHARLLEARLRVSEQYNRDLAEQRDRLKQERDQFDKEAKEIAAENERLVRARDELGRQMDEIRRSTSWRLTSPLRAVRTLIRNLGLSGS